MIALDTIAVPAGKAIRDPGKDRTEWLDECAALVRRLFESLQVPFTPGGLAETVDLRYRNTFDSPRSVGSGFVPPRRNVEAQIDTIRTITRDYTLDVRIFHVEPVRFDVNVDANEAALLVLQREVLGDRGTLALLLSADDQSVTYWHPTLGARSVARPELGRVATGIVLVVRRHEDSGERGRERRLTRSRLMRFLGASTLLLVSGVAASTATALWRAEGVLSAGLLILLFIQGAALFICLQIKKLEAVSTRNVGVFDQFCRLHERFDCRKVLGSKAARLFGVIPMSDIGMVFFVTCAGTALLAVHGLPSGHLAILRVAAVLATPYTLFSVVYQRVVVRAWCPLCLAVQAAILAQAAVMILWPWPGALKADTTGLLAGCLIATVCSWWLVRGRAIGGLRTRLALAELQLDSFQRSAAVLQALLDRSATDVAEWPSDLVLTGADGPVDVLAVLDPECFKCAHCFLALRTWAHRYGDRLRIRVRLVSAFTLLPTSSDVAAFTTRNRQAAAEEFLASWYSHILALAKQGSVASTADVTPAIYDRWRASQDVPESDEAERVVERMREWELTEGIGTWPALFVNGSEWPMLLDRRRLIPYFLDELADMAAAGDAGSRSVGRSRE